MTYTRCDRTPQNKSSERLQGSVERIAYHSEESGFCVLRVNVQERRDLVTVVGLAPLVAEGEYVECEGSWENDRRHGLQFKTHHLRIVPPTTLEGIEKYLGSGMVKGIGAHFARKLVRAFGEAVFDVIEQTPDRLLELDGIGPKRRDKVRRAWSEQQTIREIMVFLQSHGVGTARAVRIFKTYGEQAVLRVRENPYRLASDIHGIGFSSADDIARQLGIASDSLIRVRAGVRHRLQEISAQGHCAARQQALLESTASMLEVPEALVEEAIQAELAAENLVQEMIEDEPLVYLPAIYGSETGVARHLLRLRQGAPGWGVIDPRQAIPWVEQRTGLHLSPSQREAVATAIKSKVVVITGGPGVGKTTVVNSILRIVRAKGAQVRLCAPTGRAAKRLTESTGFEARTVHRLLEFDPQSMGFKHDSHDPLQMDLLVVDEVSMMDVVLMNQLLRAVPDDSALMLVGDVDQLPSVGPGSVLADIIASKTIPTLFLTEIFRQAASSRIIVNAHRINQGLLPEQPETGAASDFYFIRGKTPEEIQGKLLQVVTQRIPAHFGLHPSNDLQVLTPMNRGGLGVRALNTELQSRLNPDAHPRVSRFGWTYAPGDKVIQTVNNYDKEVFNGDIGWVRRIDEEEGVVGIEFEGREVDYELGELDEIALAYAISIHKSQGSEYPAVVIPLAMQHFMLLERNLLYTAVTRGKGLVVVIGETRALSLAVERTGSRKRLTRLRHWLANPVVLPS